MSGGRTRLELCARVEALARKDPGAPAVRFARRCEASFTVLSRAEFDALATTIAAGLRSRLEPGRVVMLRAPNRPEYPAAFLGVLRAGMTVFPVHPSLVASELAGAARRSGAAAMIDDAAPPAPALGVPAWSIDELARAGAGAARPPSGPAAMYLASSGTTGPPRIVRRLGPALDAVARNVAGAIGLGAADRVLAAIPMCHSYGVEHALLGPMWAGSALEVRDGFDPASVVPALSGGGASVFPGVPFMFEVLGGQPGPAGPAGTSLRAAYSAGAPLPGAVADRFAETWGVEVGQVYGATEVGSVTYAAGGGGRGRSGHVGAAMDGVSIRIVDPDRPGVQAPWPAGREGQVAVSAASMLAGYADEASDPGPPLVSGYFMTGDLGRLDGRGELFVTGRIKLQIDVGGLKVNPLEVEAVLAGHELVGACVVVPVAVSATVNRLKAVVVPSGPGLTPDGLRGFARARLAPHKVPRLVELRAELPRSATGKILRRLVDGDGDAP